MGTFSIWHWQLFLLLAPNIHSRLYSAAPRVVEIVRDWRRRTDHPRTRHPGSDPTAPGVGAIRCNTRSRLRPIIKARRVLCMKRK